MQLIELPKGNEKIWQHGLAFHREPISTFLPPSYVTVLSRPVIQGHTCQDPGKHLALQLLSYSDRRL